MVDENNKNSLEENKELVLVILMRKQLVYQLNLTIHPVIVNQ